MKLNNDELIKVVDVLIGETTAVGESNADEQIMKNLKAAIDLVDWLLDGIAESAKTRHRFEGSMKDIGMTAFNTLNEWKYWLTEEVDGNENHT